MLNLVFGNLRNGLFDGISVAIVALPLRLSFRVAAGAGMAVAHAKPD